MSAEDGLVLMKGQWVEVDHDRLIPVAVANDNLHAWLVILRAFLFIEFSSHADGIPVVTQGRLNYDVV
jgi:hypothetical protein